MLAKDDNVTIRLDGDIRLRLQKIVEAERSSISHVVRRAVIKLIEQHEKSSSAKPTQQNGDRNNG